MTSLVRRLPWSLQWATIGRQLTVGAALCAKGDSAKSQTVQDPVKKLFLDKIKEYRTKSAGGKLPDITPAEEKRLEEELDRLQRIYGEGQDLSKFPSFEFKDTKA